MFKITDQKMYSSNYTLQTILKFIVYFIRVIHPPDECFYGLPVFKRSTTTESSNQKSKTGDSKKNKLVDSRAWSLSKVGNTNQPNNVPVEKLNRVSKMGSESSNSREKPNSVIDAYISITQELCRGYDTPAKNRCNRSDEATNTIEFSSDGIQRKADLYLLSDQAIADQELQASLKDLSILSGNKIKQKKLHLGDSQTNKPTSPGSYKRATKKMRRLRGRNHPK